MKYVPDFDEHCGAREVYTITPNSPVENVSNLVDDNEMIGHIWVFKMPAYYRVATNTAVSVPPICLGGNRTLVVVD